MDTEQQVRSGFLEEAETYFEQMEVVLLGLATADHRRSQIDLALRAAHSIKGSAGMLGFRALSQVAHRLEDCFKILRARSIEWEDSLETLLLEGVDSLRSIALSYRHGSEIDEEALLLEAQPILEALCDRLGEVTDADETKLLADTEKINVELLIFSNGVEEALNEFAHQRPHLQGEELQQHLLATSQKLMEFGLLGQITPFIALCESVCIRAQEAPLGAIAAVADQALTVWRRAHSLAELGRLEQMPLDLAPELIPSPEIESITTATVSSDLDPDDIPLPAVDVEELAALQAALGQISDAPVIPLQATAGPSTSAALALSASAQDGARNGDRPTAMPQGSGKNGFSKNATSKDGTSKDATIRVSVDQIKQINSLFGSFFLDRNAVSLRLQQVEQSMKRMRDRLRELERCNVELRKWYDRTSLDPFATDPAGSVDPRLGEANSPLTTSTSPFAVDLNLGFDSLELDQYSSLHLLAQSQMETIVQVAEVMGDMELATRDIQQANTALNYTSRTLQSGIKRLQMRPFSEVVNRLPRIMRDLSVRYNKQVDLHIEGEYTLFERSMLDRLTDPLNHLLRNAFDHGIEAPPQRLAAGKPATGNITLTATQRGSAAVLQIRDDGQGIKFENIRQKLRQHGLPEAQIQAFSEAELLEFIFDAGFSTAAAVTELSGRGVGMDVVRSNLEQIQGRIEVTTQPGQGTTFTLILPLSLSIVRVMLLESQGFLFGCDLEAVQAVVPLEGSSWGGPLPEQILWQGQPLPLVAPQRQWQFSSDHHRALRPGKPVIDHPLVVVLRSGEASHKLPELGNLLMPGHPLLRGNPYYGVIVDRYWNEQEVSVRPMATTLPLPPGFAGVTLLGDGQIVPLLDVAGFYAQARAPEVKPLAAPLAPTRQRKTILVVDDSVHARRYLALSLEKTGFYVEQAKDGQEAVERLLGGLAVEAVICDVEMPRLDGYGLLGEIKGKPQFQDLPIVMLTSRSSDKHRRLALNLGATDYFCKPYNEADLLQRLTALMQKEAVAVEV
jgi:two-component system, chemotaxis family, sensor histidine kinase and response regulator PixL